MLFDNKEQHDALYRLLQQLKNVYAMYQITFSNKMSTYKDIYGIQDQLDDIMRAILSRCPTFYSMPQRKKWCIAILKQFDMTYKDFNCKNIGDFILHGPETYKQQIGSIRQFK